MSIKAKISQINDEKKALFTGLLDRADAFKREQREIGLDPDRSAQWMAERVKEHAERYQAERLDAVQQGMKSLESLYDGLLEDVAQAMSKAPTPEESAYPQAFCLKGRVTASDLAMAETALKGNPAALAAAYSHARECGVDAPELPSYLHLAGLHAKCRDELHRHATAACALVQSGGHNGISGELQSAIIAENPGDEFTAAALSVADYE